MSQAKLANVLTKSIVGLIAASTLILGSQAYADGHAKSACELPEHTGTIPDGSTASKEELTAAVGKFRGFQDKLAEYRDCINGEIAVVQKSKQSDEEKASMIAELSDLYDASVTVETEWADKVNTAIRAFKARQGG